MKSTRTLSKYQSAIRSFLHTKVSNPSDVEDILQDILIKIHRNIHSLKEDTSLKSWIYQISKNAVIDFYRKNGTSRQLHADDFWLSEQQSCDEDMTASEHMLAKCVEPFIQALPKDNADLLMAIYINNQSQKAYAEQYNISYSTLKSRVQCARKQLYKLFHDCCEFSVDIHGNIIDCTHRDKNICSNCEC